MVWGRCARAVARNDVAKSGGWGLLIGSDLRMRCPQKAKLHQDSDHTAKDLLHPVYVAATPCFTTVLPCSPQGSFKGLEAKRSACQPHSF